MDFSTPFRNKAGLGDTETAGTGYRHDHQVRVINLVGGGLEMV